MAVCVSTVVQKKFTGSDNAEISHSHPTYVTPDDVTFAVWGLIYTFMLITVVAQFFASGDAEAALGAVCPLTGLDARARLALALLSSAVWLFAFNTESWWTSLVLICIYLVFLLSYYQDVRQLEGYEYWLFVVSASMNSSWLVVATVVNAFLVFGEAGCKDANGVAGNVVTAGFVCVAVAALAVYMAVFGQDLAWVLVAAHALRGIYRMQTIPKADRFPTLAMSAELGHVAQWSCFLVLLVSPVALR